MEIDTRTDEIYHHGTKGMRWGVRRYQNKDGSLTKAGQKRYDTETEKLKSEKKTLRNQVRTQKKMDKLNALKKDVDDLEKTVDNKESDESRRARALSSTDPKEILKNKDVLTTAELNDRINRIDTEARLQSKIVEEHVKTGMEKVNDSMRSTTNTINNAKNFFNSVDQSYSAVANSAIGKTLAKKLGLDVPKKEFDLNDFWKNRNKKTTQEMMDVNKRLTAEENIKKKMDEKKTAKEPEKEKQKESTNKSQSDDSFERFTATGKDIFGEGTSRYEKKYGPIFDGDFRESSSSKTADRGRNYVNDILLLEDKRKKK